MNSFRYSTFDNMAYPSMAGSSILSLENTLLAASHTVSMKLGVI